MILIWLGLYFVAFFLFAFAVLLMSSPIKKFFGRQVEKYVRFKRAKGKGLIFPRQLLKEVIDFIAPLITRRSFAPDLQALIDKAGIPLRASEFIFFHGLALPVAVLVGYILAGPAGMALLGMASLILPLAGLVHLKKQRERKFHDQLPDTLSLIAGALKAGYSFLQAVDMTVKETSPPMALELKRVLTEARLGLSLEQALENMAKRVESNSFDWTVMAVKIQREVGGNLAEILEILADTIRERDRISRQVKVLTAEGRLSAVILFLLPFAVSLLLLIINPAYLLLLFTHKLGVTMVGLAVLMLAAGGLWLKKIVTVEV
ncbi:MAG: type II secretion system F family protein [Actinobacteria bacterium]|nr:type II secretion system F family protein [Actinomycetota bacterium]